MRKEIITCDACSMDIQQQQPDSIIFSLCSPISERAHSDIRYDLCRNCCRIAHELILKNELIVGQIRGAIE